MITRKGNVFLLYADNGASMEVRIDGDGDAAVRSSSAQYFTAEGCRDVAKLFKKIAKRIEKLDARVT